MPVKNAGKYLVECLNSILAQSWSDWELLAIDDHSGDNSFQILTEYKQRDSRIILLSNRGKGIIDALRYGFEKSQGEFITRMDADDIMMPLKLDSLHRELHEHGRGALAVGLVKYFSDIQLGQGYKNYESWLNQLTSTRSNFEEIYKECSIPSPAWMLHREDLNTCGAFERNIYPEDYDLAFRMRLANFTICPTKDVVHLWRDHAVRSSRTSDHYADNRFLELKLDYFINYDLDHSKKLVLWGAGKKGNKIAQLLTNNSVQFEWVTNNQNKIGHKILEKTLHPDKLIELADNTQLLIAVAQPESKYSIEERLRSQDLTPCKDYFFLC